MANELDDVVGATQNENWLLQLIDANAYKMKALEQRVQEQALILDAIYQKLKELTN
jgi:hypothetical protein